MGCGRHGMNRRFVEQELEEGSRWACWYESIV